MSITPQPTEEMSNRRGLAALVPGGDRRTLVMGILNVTPDSFSDGGRFTDAAPALAHARRMLADGADLIDVGGESTRPGSEFVPAEEELRRVVPVIRALRAETDAVLSVDTYKASVARAAVEAGARMINDIGGLTLDPDLARVAADTGAYLVVMHLRGTPQTMQQEIQYGDVVADVRAFLERQLAAAEAAGVPRERLIADPGIGFAKTVAHNLEILRRQREFEGLGVPLLIGTSRKGFIGKVLDLPVGERVEGTTATVVASIMNGAAIVRVHDVLPIARAARMTDAILHGWSGEG